MSYVKLVIRLMSVELSVDVTEKDVERISDMVANGNVEMLLSLLRDLGVDIEEIPKDISLIRIGGDYLLTRAPIFG